jgi:hypothetical protein
VRIFHERTGRETAEDTECRRVLEVVSRVLLWPVVGRALFEAPLWRGNSWTVPITSPGRPAAPNQDAGQVWLTFGNDQVARVSAGLKGRALAGEP